jgi:hypothetical protein
MRGVRRGLARDSAFSRRLGPGQESIRATFPCSDIYQRPFPFKNDNPGDDAPEGQLSFSRETKSVANTTCAHARGVIILGLREPIEKPYRLQFL